jgi:hypothetical protein
MTNLDHPESLLTPAQAAQFLHVSERTLEGWRHGGGGPDYVAISARCVRYSPAVLREFVAVRTHSSAVVESI